MDQLHIEQLHIENPCPMRLQRMKQEGENYHCKSCGKNLVDFRQKSSSEIRATIQPGICGIFNRSQLPAQQSQSLVGKLLFYALAFVSVLGFPVKPLKAQSGEFKKTRQSSQMPFPEVSYGETNSSESLFGSEFTLQKDKPKCKNKKWRKKKKKKREYRTIGTPSF